MLTYRGDKFVKGKKFTINESVYRFVKRDKDENLIFESVNNKRMIKLTESEYELKEQQLLEKINKENQEINSIIGQALRSKSVAKKYEDKLKSYGITVDFDQSQGATLIGPNGKRLSAGLRRLKFDEFEKNGQIKEVVLTKSILECFNNEISYTDELISIFDDIVGDI